LRATGSGSRRPASSPPGPRLLRFLASRALQALAVSAAVATLAFVLIRIAPGNACGDVGEGRQSSAAAERCVRRLHLDRPIVVQYGEFVRSLLHGELGESTATGEPVLDRIAVALPNTILLVTLGLIASTTLGVAVAVRRYLAATGGQLLDALLLIAFALPDFWVAQVLLLTFAFLWPLFPPHGAASFGADYLATWPWLVDRVRHLVLPVTAITIVSAASVARFQYAALREVQHDDFLRTARAKGLGERAIVMRHALRVALGPVIALIGVALPAIVGGAVFVERIFGWPGMGSLIIDAVSARDGPVVVACLAIGGVATALGGLVADVLAAIADPRLREPVGAGGGIDP